MTYEEILNKALSLPDADRMWLALILDESLNRPPAYSEQEFAAVLQQRMHDLQSGKVEFVDAFQALQETRERLQQRRASQGQTTSPL